MAWTWSSRLALRGTARKQNQSLMLVSSRCDSPTDLPASEAEDIPDSRSQETGPPSLRTLPTELVLLISELLPVEDALCLALTCKRMLKIAHNYRIFGTRLDKDATNTLLCRLEMDNPKFTYCFMDQELKLVRTLYGKLLECQPHSHKDKSLESFLYIESSMFLLSYCTARMVTNHQLLGPPHGVPASSLACTYDRQLLLWDGVYWSEEWAANTIHGELFLARIDTFLHKEANAGALRQYFNAENIGICNYMGIGGGRASRELIRLPRNAIGNTNHHDSGWCRKCETDWEVSIELADAERGWMVTVRTYHGLGACRSPNDWKWRAMHVRSNWHREVPRGAVKELWEQQHASHGSVDQL